MKGVPEARKVDIFLASSESYCSFAGTTESQHMGDFVDDEILLILKYLFVNSYDALRLLATRDCVAENGIYIRRNDGKR
jgi:hypothetical protein